MPRYATSVSAPSSRSSLPRSLEPFLLADLPLSFVSPRLPHHGAQRHSSPWIDAVDRLDQSGAHVYHHESRYDPITLARLSSDRNRNPLAAVHESTMRDLYATPEHFVRDSLVLGVPLEGTATVPPGARCLDGKVMSMYDEIEVEKRESCLEWLPKDHLQEFGGPAVANLAVEEETQGKARKGVVRKMFCF
jgi:hypothetical protein